MEQGLNKVYDPSVVEERLYKQWEENADKCKDEIFPAMLGWDVTDYGQDRFSELGAVLFTSNDPAEAIRITKKLGGRD